MIFLICSLLISLVSGVPLSEWNDYKCAESCKIKIVESIPFNVTFPGYTLPQSTADAWLDLFGRAKRHITIAAYKTSLQAKHVIDGEELEEFSTEGDAIFSLLMDKSKNVTITLVDKSEGTMPDYNLDGSIMEDSDIVSRSTLDMEKVLGKGVNHIKLIIVDDTHFYIGSANLDWRSLNQKMEMGVVVTDCPCLGDDARRLFNVLWGFSGGKNITEKLPARYNASHPFKLNLGSGADVFLSGAPKEMLNAGRTPDVDAIVSVIRSAKEYLFMHVMDYFPLYLYQENENYWSKIDNSIRDAVIRGVKVRMIGAPVHYESVGVRFLKSLQDLDGMEGERTTDIMVKIFVVPPINATWEINDNRRTHNKFIVTENEALIGTSNWSADYFEGSTGASIVVKQSGKSKPFIDQLTSIFKRDYYSPYAHYVNDYYHNCILERTAIYCQLNKDLDEERLEEILAGTYDVHNPNNSSFFSMSFLVLLLISLLI